MLSVSVSVGAIGVSVRVYVCVCVRAVLQSWFELLGLVRSVSGAIRMQKQTTVSAFEKGISNFAFSVPQDMQKQCNNINFKIKL